MKIIMTLFDSFSCSSFRSPGSWVSRVDYSRLQRLGSLLTHSFVGGGAENDLPRLLGKNL